MSYNEVARLGDARAGQYECMPIFKHFTPETLVDMVAQPWENKRLPIDVQVIPDDQSRTRNVCPIAYCLWKDGKMWSGFDQWGMSLFTGAPDESKIARMLMGIGPDDEIPDGRVGEYRTLEAEAYAFYRPWDVGYLTDLERAACVHELSEAAAV